MIREKGEREREGGERRREERPEGGMNDRASEGESGPCGRVKWLMSGFQFSNAIMRCPLLFLLTLTGLYHPHGGE